MAEPTGQFSIAFDDGSLVWVPTWTHLAQDYPNLVTSYSIDRGRQYELDHTDVGRATVTIADVDGVLDPTNGDGPFFGRIHPWHQAAIARWNPVTDQWYTRFRGFVDGYSYDFDPSQRVNRLTVTLVDLQALLSTIELVPGAFGIDTTGTSAEGQVGFAIQNFDDRIEGVLTQAGIPDSFTIVFSGNVELHANVYSPGESVMDVIMDALDAEWPGISNGYVDRLGRLCCHGRQAKFDPAGTAASAGSAHWDYQEWTVGDGAAVNAAPTTTAHVRAFSFERGSSKLINSAIATPIGIADTDVAGQVYQDAGSISTYGYRSWSAQNLITRRGLVDSSSDLVETKRFAEYYVENYKAPRNRITTVTFRSMRPTDPRAAANWLLLSKIDIADSVVVTVGSPGGGGFAAEEFFVEGVHEQGAALNANYDDVTLSLDLSPKAYFDDNPFPLP